MDIKVFFAILSLLIQGLTPITPQPQATVLQPAVVKPRSFGNFDRAVTSNKELLYRMSWDFAGTKQHGLYLYLPLITEIIGSHRSFDTTEFASAMANWQQQQGLPVTGILDEDSWQRMVEWLQTNRLKSREYPPLEELVTVSSDLYFDPTRPEDLRKVHVKAFEAYQRMVAAARADKMVAAALADSTNPEAKNYFKIISSWRSHEYQDKLRQNQGGNLGRIALAKNSPHFTGRALDIYVGGLPVSTEDKNRAKQIASPIYQWLVHNAAQFGFRPYFYEPWHWEYIGESETKLEAKR